MRHQSGGADVVRTLVAGYGALLNRVAERVSELPLWALPRGRVEGGLQAAVSAAEHPGVYLPPWGRCDRPGGIWVSLCIH